MSTKVEKAFVVFAGQVFNLLIVFLLTPYLSRSLPKTDYGTYAQVLILSNFFIALFSLGLSRVYYLVVEKKEFNPQDSHKTILVTSFFLGVIASVCCYILSPEMAVIFGNAGLKGELSIYAPYFALNFVNTLLELSLIHKGLVKRNVIVVIAVNVFKIALLLIAIHVIKDFDFIYWSLGFICPFIQFLCYLFILGKNSILGGTFRKEIFYFIIKMGYPLGITGILATSYSYLSGFIISYYYSPSDFAIYRNGSIEIPFLSIIATSIGSILTPHFALSLSKGDFKEVVRVKSTSITQVAAISYPIVISVLFFSRELLTLYLSDKYIESVPIFFIYTFILFIRVNSYDDVLTGLGRSREILYANVVYFISNVVLVYSFTKFWGIYGSALGTTIGIYILAFFLMMRTAKRLSVKIGEIVNFLDLAKIIAVSILLLSFIKGLYLLWPNYYVMGMVLFAYFIIIYYSLIKLRLINIFMYAALIDKVPFVKYALKMLNIQYHDKGNY